MTLCQCRLIVGNVFKLFCFSVFVTIFLLGLWEEGGAQYEALSLEVVGKTTVGETKAKCRQIEKKPSPQIGLSLRTMLS